MSITKAIQLLSSNDIQIATICNHQLRYTIENLAGVNNTIPVMTFYQAKRRMDSKGIEAKAQLFGPEPDLLPSICKRILKFPIHKI